MKNKKLFAILTLLCFMFTFMPVAAMAEGEAPGLSDDLVIDDLAELKAFRDSVNRGTTYDGQTVKLNANINLADEDWTPIGNTINYFRGTFDGQNHIISNMTINASTPDTDQFAGLFGAVQNATVENLTMENVNINVTGSKVRAAAIAALASSDTTQPNVLALNFENINIKGCTITAEAKSSSAMVGGIAGYCYPANQKDISVSNLTINGKAADSNTLYAAGIAGYVCGQNISNNSDTRMAFTVEDFKLNDIVINADAYTVLAGGYTGRPYYGYITLKDGTITNIQVDVDAHEAFVGGLVGYFWRSDNGHTVDNINITGIDFDVTTDYLGETRVGGMVGTSQSVVDYNDCSVAGTITERCSDSDNPVNYHAKVGGFVGRAYTWAQTYTDCVADVDVTGSHVAGGFVGNHITNAEYTDCEAKGDVKATIAGGFAGRLTENGFSTDVTFDSCAVSGNVEGSNFAGGFIGSTADYGWGDTTGTPYGKNITIKNCEITGNVKGNGEVAGVIGEANVAAGKTITLENVSYNGNNAVNATDESVVVFPEGSHTVTFTDGLDGTIFHKVITGIANETVISEPEIDPNIREGFSFKWDKEFVETVTTSSVYTATWTKETSTSSSGGGFSGKYNYPVNIADVDGATVTSSDNYAVAGETVTITIDPDAGKQVDEVIVTDADGDIIPVTKVGDNKYTFTMPAGKVNVAVTTEAADYDLRIVMQINNKNILVNDRTITNDVAPVIVGDRTLVPVRIVTELLGGTADWDNTTRTVTLTIDGKVLKLVIDQPIPGFGTSATIMNDRTYVPIRYVAEKLGASVEWIAETQQIIIEK